MGDCNVIVSLEEDDNIRDVFQVKVSMAMEPAGPIYLSQMGSQQMRVTEPTRQGRWHSEHPGIAEIHETTGVLRARGEGQTRIHYSDPTTHLDLSQEVNVGRVGDLMLSGGAP